MLHIYRMYKYVKMVDRENIKVSQRAFIAVQEGRYTPEQIKLIAEGEAGVKFANKRILFKKIGLPRAGQTGRAAIKNEYLELADKDDGEEINRLRVTHLKGLPFIDGIPFIRFGLWKALYDEHGWLLTIIPSTALAAVLLYLYQRFVQQ